MIEIPISGIVVLVILLATLGIMFWPSEHDINELDLAEDMILKPWGYEVIWAHTDKYVGKILSIKQGHKLSLQYHEEKEETIMVVSGTLRLHYGDLLEDGSYTIETKEMTVYDRHHVKPGDVHRFEAITDCTLIEVSTPELDDVVRLVDDYGREGT